MAWFQMRSDPSKKRRAKKKRKASKKKPAKTARKKVVKKPAKKRKKRTPREDRWKGRKRFQAPSDLFHPEEYEVLADLDKEIAEGFVKVHHYSGTLPPGANKRYGLYHKKSRRLVGVAAYGQPGGPKVLASSFPNLEDLARESYDPKTGLWYPRPLKVSQHAAELIRLVLLDEVPFNAESWFVAQTFDHLRGQRDVRGVVSFSDPFYGHIGTVYKALSATYTGMTRAGWIWRYKDTETEIPRRIITKIQAADTHWAGCHGTGRSTSGWEADLATLIEHGAPPPKARGRNRECLREWLKRVLPKIATRERHGGKHRYIWGLTKGAQGDIRQRLKKGELQTLSYPELLLSNPDPRLRGLGRSAAGGDPEAQVAHARARRRSGEKVSDWKLFPVSYVFLEAHHELEAGRDARVEAYRDPVWRVGRIVRPPAALPEAAPERFYVAASSYPLLDPKEMHLPYLHGLRLIGEEEEQAHLAAVEAWRNKGAIVVRLAFEAQRKHLAEGDHGAGRHYDEQGICTYCRWIDAYRWRVLVKVRDVRNARKRAEGWAAGYQDVLLPAQWDWARIMKKRKGRWKNNPR